METWDEYKKAMISEQPEFNWAREGNRMALAEYFRHGGSVNAKNHKGYSLLMLAAYNDHWSTCAWLLQKGADVNSIDISGNSVLMGTCFKGHVRIIKLLLSSGADPFMQNCYGMTALDLAKAFGRLEVIRVLTEEPPIPKEHLAKVVKLISRRITSSNREKSREDLLN
ncbi:MAG: ankyrin repeat domain-containing protein [Pseudobdellovibrionaceae bacterium]